MEKQDNKCYKIFTILGLPFWCESCMANTLGAFLLDNYPKWSCLVFSIRLVQLWRFYAFTKSFVHNLYSMFNVYRLRDCFEPLLEHVFQWSHFCTCIHSFTYPTHRKSKPESTPYFRLFCVFWFLLLLFIDLLFLLFCLFIINIIITYFSFEHWEQLCLQVVESNEHLTKRNLISSKQQYTKY